MSRLILLASEVPPTPVVGLTDERWGVVVGVCALLLLAVGTLLGRNL